MTQRRSPIEMLMDKGMRCVRCDAPMDGCNCWDKITLRCPKCKRTIKATKEETDPKGTATVECTCDKCDDGGGFPETHYYDAQGRWWDGNKFTVVRGETVTPLRLNKQEG